MVDTNNHVGTYLLSLVIIVIAVVNALNKTILHSQSTLSPGMDLALGVQRQFSPTNTFYPLDSDLFFGASGIALETLRCTSKWFNQWFYKRSKLSVSEF